MSFHLTKVVSERGQSAWAVTDTPYRIGVTRRDSRSWRWRAWHVWNNRTIGEGCLPRKDDAKDAAIAAIEWELDEQ